MPLSNKPGPGDEATEQALRELVERAQKGSEVDLDALCQALDKDPAIWRRVGDLAGLAEQSLLQLADGGNALLRESLERQLAEMKKELAGPDATPLERLLAQRV